MPDQARTYFCLRYGSFPVVEFAAVQSDLMANVTYQLPGDHAYQVSNEEHTKHTESYYTNKVPTANTVTNVRYND